MRRPPEKKDGLDRREKEQHFHREEGNWKCHSGAAMVRHSRVWYRAARPTVPLDAVAELLVRSGATSTRGGAAGALRRDNPAVQLFTPLFTPDFAFENQQLTTLGDTIIDAYLSQAMLDYTTHAGLTVTVNAARQMNAVLHNHYALRLFASELGFNELSVPYESLTAAAAGADAGAEDSTDGLTFLEPQRLGPRQQDLSGTSFQCTPLRAGQSSLGWKYSHFIGAVHCLLGEQAAHRAVSSAYGGLEHVGNLPRHAVALLERVLQRFPPGCVTEAVLAAQGLPARFLARTRVVEWEDPEAVPAASASGSSGPADSHWSCDGLVAVDGFGDPARASPDGSGGLDLDALSKARDAFMSLASGPGGIDAVGGWKRRTDALVARGLEPPQVSSTADGAVVEAVGSGWLSAEEHEPFRRRPAFANSVDFSIPAAAYFADTYGVAHPVDGQKVGRVKFKSAVRDPVFYDKQSDMRNGVPFDTDGVPLHEYLARFTAPHRRLFEVALHIGMGEGRVAGKAVSTRYSIARRAVSIAYLGAVVRDLNKMAEQVVDRGDGGGS